MNSFYTLNETLRSSIGGDPSFGNQVCSMLLGTIQGISE
jgi:hypothetical protein